VGLFVQTLNGILLKNPIPPRGVGRASRSLKARKRSVAFVTGRERGEWPPRLSRRTADGRCGRSGSGTAGARAGGWKADVSRGERNGRVSSGWVNMGQPARRRAVSAARRSLGLGERPVGARSRPKIAWILDAISHESVADFSLFSFSSRENRPGDSAKSPGRQCIAYRNNRPPKISTVFLYFSVYILGIEV